MDTEAPRRGPGRPPKVQPADVPAGMKPVRILHGYWPKDGGKKIPAGEVVHLPTDEARAAYEAGIADRADAF